MTSVWQGLLHWASLSLGLGLWFFTAWQLDSKRWSLKTWLENQGASFASLIGQSKSQGLPRSRERGMIHYLFWSDLDGTWMWGIISRLAGIFSVNSSLVFYNVFDVLLSFSDCSWWLYVNYLIDHKYLMITKLSVTLSDLVTHKSVGRRRELTQCIFFRSLLASNNA